MSDDALDILSVEQTIAISEVSTTISIEDSITESVVISEVTPDTITIEECQEYVLNILDVSGAPGPAGPAGGNEIPSTVTIYRENNEISLLVFDSGKTVAVNREDGEIVSVFDGTYMKTIVREDGEITQVRVTE